MVETFYISICFHGYVIAQQLHSPTYALVMTLYQISVQVLQLDNEQLGDKEQLGDNESKRSHSGS